MVMAALDAEDLVRAYWVQITQGCDSHQCLNQRCKSHPTPHSTLLEIRDATDAALLALKYTYGHPRRSLMCPGLSPFAQSRDIRRFVPEFDALVASLIRSESPCTDPEKFAPVAFVLADRRALSCALMSNSDRLSPTNLALDDELLRDFQAAMRRSHELCRQFEYQFIDAVVELLRQPTTNYLHMRALILVFSFDLFCSGENYETLVCPILEHVSTLSDNLRSILFENLQKMPFQTRQIVNFVQDSLTGYLAAHPDKSADDRILTEAAKFLQQMREGVSFRSQKTLPTSAFCNAAYTALVPLDAYQDPSLPVWRYPAILTLQFKSIMLERELVRAQDEVTRQVIEAARNEYLSRNIQWVLRSELQARAFLILTVSRDDLIEDSILLMGDQTNESLKRRLIVNFRGEEGVDAGGVTREYFHLVIEQAFSPDYGLFRVLRNRYHWFNSAALLPKTEARRVYRWLGTLVALALFNQMTLPLRFPLLLYKKLVGRPIGHRDLEDIDPELMQSFASIKEMKAKGEDVSAVGLRFTATQEIYGEIRTVPLVDGGETMDVTNENCEDYIDRYFKWFTTTSIETAFEAFSVGFYKLFDERMLEIFSADEFDVLVSGETELDWGALRDTTLYREIGRAHV
jgi:hypothetical protein